MRPHVTPRSLAAAIAIAVTFPAAAHGAQPTTVATVPFATNVGFDSAGRMWVTSAGYGPESSDGVWYVPKSGKPRHVVSAGSALGLRWAGGRLYLAHTTSSSNGRVTSFSGFDGHRFRGRRVEIDHLLVGQHTVDSIAERSDGRLFVGVGSTRDNSGPPGRILSFSPGRHVARLEADGLRNPYGLAFHGRDLLVTDNGRDDLGAFTPPDELNAFDPAGPAGDFGFPDCYDQGGPACEGKVAPLVTFAAHASADGIAVKGDVAYVAENGSSVPANPSGSIVVRVDLNTHARTTFWRSPVKHDPLGAAIGPDGALYVTLFNSDRVIRFADPR